MKSRSLCGARSFVERATVVGGCRRCLSSHATFHIGCGGPRSRTVGPIIVFARPGQLLHDRQTLWVNGGASMPQGMCGGEGT